MRKLIILTIILGLVLTGCFASDPNSCSGSPSDPNQVTQITTVPGQTDPDVGADDTRPSGELQESDVKTTDPSDPVATDPADGGSDVPLGPTVPEDDDETQPSRPQSSEDSTKPTDPPQNPTESTIPEADPTVPSDPTDPTESTQPTEPTVPEEPEETESQPSEPEVDKTSYAFKQEVARYAAQYINQYRQEKGVPTCTVLPGMTLVAEYRADQLTYNYGHDSADIREALAYYQYGRYVDGTLLGWDPSESYYEADTAEAICAGFEGKTAEEMGKYIADLVVNSSSHWSYVGSSRYSYIAVGVEYRAGSTYGWYGCIMVGTTNYG